MPEPAPLTPGKPLKIIAFDLETTGVRPESDRILEFCFIELDSDLVEVGRWGDLVDPGVPIPKEIVELTGITAEMIAGKSAFALYAGRIQRLVQDAILVAHNHEFDLRFLNQELTRAGQPGLPPDHPCIDTVQIERQFVNNKLESVYRRYTGRSIAGAHRSEADTVATVEVLRHQRIAHAEALPGNIQDLVVARLESRFEGRDAGRQWLDHDHRFYRDPAGDVRFGFGKYRDCPAVLTHACATDRITRAHDDYLVWMKGKDFSVGTKATIDLVLQAKPATAPALTQNL